MKFSKNPKDIFIFCFSIFAKNKKKRGKRALSDDDDGNRKNFAHNFTSVSPQSSMFSVYV
jgi:hypothetical protein